MNLKKILAFTLAEVLLTMTIVGAIAAMTIPTLMAKRVQTERTAKLRKFYSRMTNAIDLMGMAGDSYKYISRPGTTASERYGWYLEHIDRYMGHKFLDSDNKRIYYADASSLSFSTADLYSSSASNIDNCPVVTYDTNGLKLPNTHGADRYTFLFCFDSEQRERVLGAKETFFGAYAGSAGIKPNTTEAEAITKCRDSSRNCTKLLQNNNWEYPANYPFK